MTSTGSNHVVVSRGKDLEKIEQLEEENEHLRKVLAIVRENSKRAFFVAHQFDRLLAAQTMESDSDSDYSDSEY